jgi:hypothetical protein
MEFRNLKEIWAAEIKYDKIRWSPERSVSELPLEELLRLRGELPDVVNALTIWTDKKSLSAKDHQRLSIVRRKLQDFQWKVIEEVQRLQRNKFLSERLDSIVEPEAHGKDAKHMDYGLKSPLKGSDFYKDIPETFGPQSKEGRR